MGMKPCKHKYLFQIKGQLKLLNVYQEFACIKCGLHWRYDDKLALSPKFNYQPRIYLMPKTKVVKE